MSEFFTSNICMTPMTKCLDCFSLKFFLQDSYFAILDIVYFEGIVVFIPFQRASAGRVHCNQTTISSQTLLYGGDLVCHIKSHLCILPQNNMLDEINQPV